MKDEDDDDMTDEEKFDEAEAYKEWKAYQDDPDRDAGEVFQDKLDRYRNEY